jgi:hypothetical protein
MGCVWFTPPCMDGWHIRKTQIDGAWNLDTPLGKLWQSSPIIIWEKRNKFVKPESSRKALTKLSYFTPIIGKAPLGRTCLTSPLGELSWISIIMLDGVGLHPLRKVLTHAMFFHFTLGKDLHVTNIHISLDKCKFLRKELLGTNTHITSY